MSAQGNVVCEGYGISLRGSLSFDDGDQEGIPDVLKEAMAMGLAVLSALHRGIR